MNGHVAGTLPTKSSNVILEKSAADVCLQRWAVYECCRLLADYSAEYEALQEAMKSRSSVAECIRAIEMAGTS